MKAGGSLRKHVLVQAGMLGDVVLEADNAVLRENQLARLDCGTKGSVVDMPARNCSNTA